MTDATAARSETTIRIETVTVSAADLNAANPLATVADASEPPYEVTGELPEAIREGMDIGQVRNLFPYTMQDAYGRERNEKPFTAVVLENAHLKATVLPELGGRVWSLRDRDRDVELLHVNSAVQYANLALRDAWFAGGIEWNIGTRGHSPSTASPLHAARVATPEGDALRMWEYDRLRGTVFQIDLSLPTDSRVLLAYVRIQNVSGSDAPMYWWTNAAVPQTEHTRVITPSSSSIATDYDGRIGSVPVTPELLSPGHAPFAADYFFDPVEGSRPWLAARDENGDGLALLSTERLQGRKLFCWGEGQGGHRWQRWLTPDGRHYAELQSGLARTQFEHLMMPADASWDWVEAYGNIALDGTDASADTDAVAHTDTSADTDAARAADRVERLWPASDMDRTLEDARRRADLPTGDLITEGSGWGLLEERRRGEAFASPGTPFGVTTPDVEPWLELLRTGELPEASRRTFPGAYVSGPAWEELLRAAPRTWQTTAHLGTMAHAAGEREKAAACYAASFALGQNMPALRGRALLRAEDGNTRQASGDYLSLVGHALPGAQRALAIEGASVLLAAGDAAGALRVLDAASAEVQSLGRIRFLRATALHEQGRDDEAGRMLRDGIEVANIREGDQAVSDLWEKVFPHEELPVDYDFRMKN